MSNTNMLTRVFIILTAYCLFSLNLTAQELLLPLQSNPVKAQHINETKSTGSNEDITLELPFFDDFSYKGPYPDNTLWADSFVLINSSYPVHPVTIGVATFDALDQYGRIYDYENNWQFVADHLTSHKIRLDSVFEPASRALTPGDSIYISFYFQPQGTGLAPNDRDSLVLEFLHTPGHYSAVEGENDLLADDPGNEEDTVWVEDRWVSVWSSEGESLPGFSGDTIPFFSRVMIPVTDTVYYRDDFRFRFKNYSSFPTEKEPTNFSGNRSIWNIDYVTLDHGRSIADTFYYDIAFAKPARSILKRYTSMPWSHYISNPASHLKDNLEVAIKNLNNIEHNYTYSYHIKDEDGRVIRNYSGGTWNIAPFHLAGYQNYAAHSNPVMVSNPLPTAPAEKRHFKIVHALKEGTTGDDNRRNDTVYYDQVFENYFAYDDGISNAAYVLDGFDPQSASRFILSHPDTLHGIKMYFNSTPANIREGLFKLKVWKSLDPEKVVYESEVMKPGFGDDLNQYFYYSFEDDRIFLEDTFYIGWEQTSSARLFVGWDVNNTSGGNLFYNTDGKWQPSVFEGALMIRPVIGQRPHGTYVEEPKESFQINLYPNPVNGNWLNVSFDKKHVNEGDAYIQIYNMEGQLMINDRLRQAIPVENFPNGIYIVRIFEKDTSRSLTTKIVISR